MDPNNIPTPDLLAIINRGTRGQPLTLDEVRKLQTWAAANAATTDPAWITAISNVIASAPGGQAAANGYDPVTGQPPTPVWQPPASATAVDQSTPATSAGQTIGMGEDWKSQLAATDPDVEPQPTMGDFDPAASTWPDPSAGQPDDPTNPRQRRRDRAGGGNGRTPDYGLDMPNPLNTTDSAFAGLDPGALSTIADNPDIAARYLARKRGNENGAPILSEAMRNALALSGMGLLGGARGMSRDGKRDLSSIPGSSAERLRRAENWLGQMEADGTFADPQAAYKKMFRRVRNTDPSLLSTGEGEPGDMENQINVTTGALLDAAQAAGMDDDNLGWLQARLGQASQEYVMGVAEGSIDPVLMSYPNWLRTEKKAQRWLGR